MNIYDATEQAYKNGYQQGRRDAVKHGRWIFSRDGLYWWCSLCAAVSLEDTCYCPLCGAQMDLPELYDPDIPREQWEDRAKFDD